MKTAIMAFVLAVLCGQCFGQAKKEKPPKTVKTIEVVIDFDPIEKTKDYIRDNCNDPAKLSFVSVGKPLNSAGCLIYRKDIFGDDMRSDAVAWGRMPNGIVVGAKYRTANAIGAIVITERAFLLDAKGNVVAEYAARDIRTDTKGLNDTDPFADAFLKNF